MTFTFPAARIIDPKSVTSYRWGIMGAAGIAETFVATVQKNSTQKVVAVASRTPGKANGFAEKFGLEAHDSYEALLAREDIDIIYIPTLPSQHYEHALMAIAAGKHVLIEKPLTLRVSEAKEIFAAAKDKGVLAMEAMWTRYLPHYDVIRQVLESGVLGEIEMVMISMCQAQVGITPRMWQVDGGDPLFDMGIYPISFVQTFLGNPTSITAQGILNDDKIDEEISAQLHYANGSRAYIVSSGKSHASGIAQINGSKGRLNVGPEFFLPATLHMGPNEFNPQLNEWNDNTGIKGHEGLFYEAVAMAKFLDDGLLESPYESHADSIANLETAAEIIRLVGAKVVS